MLLHGCSAGRDEANPPDVVLIMLDTLRPDHLDLFDYDVETAPYLRELGLESVRFEHAYSTSSFTPPATASLFTGVYATRHKVFETFWAGLRQGLRNLARDADAPQQQQRANVIPADLATLPEMMQTAGYETFGISSNVNIGKKMGFARGFDHFVQLRLKRGDAPQIVARLREWEAELRAASPRFVYLHFMDPHSPYNVRRGHMAPWRPSKGYATRRYDGEIHYLDEQLGLLHDWLEFDRNTLVIIVSDHGEEFGGHGASGHGFSLYGELNRVLFLIYGPSLGIEPALVRAPVSLVDVVPTIAELVGLPSDEGWEGMSLAPLLSGSTRLEASGSFERRPVFAHRLRSRGGLHELWSVVEGRWKLLIEADGRERIYDAIEDPLDSKNLAGAQPEVREHLSGLLDDFLAEAEAAGIEANRVPITLDPQSLEELRALGYADPE